MIDRRLVSLLWVAALASSIGWATCASTKHAAADPIGKKRPCDPTLAPGLDGSCCTDESCTNTRFKPETTPNDDNGCPPCDCWTQCDGGGRATAQVRCLNQKKPEVVMKARAMQVLDGKSVLARLEFLEGVYAQRVITVRGIDVPEYGDVQPCDGDVTVFWDAVPATPLAKLRYESTENLHRLLSTDVFFIVRPRATDVPDQFEAGVFLPAGQDVAAAQVAAGYAKPYNGDGPRPDWCAIAKEE